MKIVSGHTTRTRQPFILSPSHETFKKRSFYGQFIEERKRRREKWRKISLLDLCIFWPLRKRPPLSPKILNARNLVGGKPVLLTRRYSFQDQCRNWYGTYPTNPAILEGLVITLVFCVVMTACRRAAIFIYS